jgi:hypothetical protein
MDRKPGPDDAVSTVSQTAAETARAPRAEAKAPVDPRVALAINGTWQASSFDLAQGLDVKEMQSKLSPDTLDRLFRT